MPTKHPVCMKKHNMIGIGCYDGRLLACLTCVTASCLPLKHGLCHQSSTKLGFVTILHQGKCELWSSPLLYWLFLCQSNPLDLQTASCLLTPIFFALFLSFLPGLLPLLWDCNSSVYLSHHADTRLPKGTGYQRYGT